VGQLSSIYPCAIIKYTSKSIITTNKNKSRLPSNRDLQRNIAEDHMAIGLYALKGRDGVFIHPVFEIAHKEEIALKNSIAATACVNNSMRGAKRHLHSSLYLFAPF
jgi:hypothetical protein